MRTYTPACGGHDDEDRTRDRTPRGSRARRAADEAHLASAEVGAQTPGAVAVLGAVPTEQDGDVRAGDPDLLRGRRDLLYVREQGRARPHGHDRRPAPGRPVVEVPARHAGRRDLRSLARDRRSPNLAVLRTP